MKDTTAALIGPFQNGGKNSHPERTLTDEDMRELADYMIGLWTRFKETLRS
jgi:hypothetical protein